MEKINTVNFCGGTTTRTITGLYQWDSGQVLRIEGLNLPTAVEVHFALRRSGEAMRRIGVTKDDVTEVDIPDSLFWTMATSDYDAYAYIYVSDEKYGNTTHEVIMKIKSRPMPENIQNDFDAIMKAVKEIADGKIDKNQGVENNGKYLGVVDGYVVLVDAPVGTGGTSDVVRCTPQTLTDTQKEQARANIGAASATEVSQLSEEIKEIETEGTGIDEEAVNVLIEQYIADNHIAGVTSEEIQAYVKQYIDENVSDDTISTSVTVWLNEHPEVTTTVQKGSISEEHLTEELQKKIKNTVVSGSILGDTTQAEGSASFVEMFQKVKNEVMLEYMGDINKIPVIVHTDQHGALNASVSIISVFETIDKLVNWCDISKVINLGDCVNNAWRDASDIPFLSCTELENVAKSVESIPIEKQLNVFGNHDQFTWDSDANTYGPQMEEQSCLQQYFRNINAHRRSNNGWFTVEDGYFNVKYVVTSAYEGTIKFATTKQFDFLISELGKDDGFDIVLIAHELYNPDYVGRVFPTTSDMKWKGSAENDNNYGMGLNVNAILTARKNKTAGTFTDGSGVVHEFDFSNCKTDLLCSLHGHTHYETYNYVEGNYLNVALSPMNHTNRWIFFCLIDRVNQKLKVWKMPTSSSLTEYTYEKYEIPFDISDAEVLTIKNRIINCAVFNTSASIRVGQPYSQYVKAKSGYTLGTVKLIMGGTDVTSDYYDVDTQLIYIPAVTGNLELSVYDSTIDADTNVYVALENYDSETVNKTLFTGNVIANGGSYKAGFSPKAGYRLDIIAYMDGMDITSTCVTNSVVEIGEVTGDIEVYVTSIPITLTNEYVDYDGTVTEDNTSVLSGYEDVSGYDYINVAFGSMGGYRYVAQYDKDYNFISRTDDIKLGSSTNNNVYLSENTKYIRFGNIGVSPSDFTTYWLRKYIGVTYANVTINTPDTVNIGGIVNTIKYGNNLVLTVTDTTGYDDVEISATATVGGSEVDVILKDGVLTVPYITGDTVVTVKSVRPLMYELPEETVLSGDGTSIDTGVAPMDSLESSFTILCDYTPNTPPSDSFVFVNYVSSLPNNNVQLKKYTGTNLYASYAGVGANVSGINANTERCKVAVTHVGGSESYDANWTFNTEALSEPVKVVRTNPGGSGGARRVSTANIVIGGTWKGTIHAFQIWNKVLTDEEIAAFVAFEEILNE